ncbi:MAG: hypothetical protein M9952_02720 [Microthrixaceae bacterium]|nr:hypothetical protein [Microthrixaceae bacterium]
MGGQDVGRVAAFDPVMTVLWDSLDGVTTVNDLAVDVASSLGLPIDPVREQVAWFVASLEQDGMLADVDQADVVSADPFPPIPADSCLGRRLGLGRMTMVRIERADGSFLAGSTEPEAVLSWPDHIVVDNPDDWGGETYYLRLTRGSVRAPRAQQVFDSTGQLIYVSRDVDAAMAAFHRTLAGRIDAAERVAGWIGGPALLGDRGVTLVHPAMAGTVFGPIRSALERGGLSMVPAGVLRVGDGSVIAVGGGNAKEEEFPLEAVLLPGAPTGPVAVRRLLDFFLYWDQVSFDAAKRVATATPIFDVDLVMSRDDLVRQILAVGTSSSR